MHYSPFKESIFTQPVGRFNQLTYSLDTPVHLILSGVEHSPAYFCHIGKTGNNRIDIQRISVFQQEAIHLELTHRVHGILTSAFTYQPHIIRISVSGKSSGIIQNTGNAFVFFHFIKHRTLHLTSYIHQAFVRPYHNHIVIRQTDIALCIPVQDVIVDVDG